MKAIAAILLIVALFACKKDSSVGTGEQQQSTQTSKKLYPVTFKLGQFSTDVKPFGLKTSDLKDQIKFLHYSSFINYIHGPDDEQLGEKVTTINQVADSTANFGTIRDSLPEGDYVIIFAGGNTSPFRGFNFQGPGGYYAAAVDQAFPFGDSFGNGMRIHVGDSVINKEIVLKRMVSKITIKITDALPANAAKFVLTVGNMAPVVFPINQHPPGEHGYPFDDQFITFPLKTEDAGKKNYTLTTYVYYGNEYFILTCYNQDGAIIANKTMPVVPDQFIDVNKQYNFSGKLFENSSSFQISIDDQWGESEDIPFGYHSDKSIK
ncbi:hypothetical protein GS399_16690 [Pedobacter sp. HMF7647]|uniref:DUF4382 domain-containing protein n=1 Tax=Hufsiella arboris TaxID=2695275 RepID=A0A7K1YDF0_9SPHI|nr:FimB/Mfa2 family fimbrial subunit [Hufsiella arboris]MXV52613.1 hypothetical protein [Hufsiella arboris]